MLLIPFLRFQRHRGFSMTKKSLVSIRSIIAFKTLMIRIRPLRGSCGSIDQYCVHHNLAMQSLLKVKAEDTGYHSLRCFTGRWSVELFYLSVDWEMNATSLGCVPFGGSHTALKTLDLIKEVTFFSFFFFPIYIYINVTFSNKF